MRPAASALARHAAREIDGHGAHKRRGARVRVARFQRVHHDLQRARFFKATRPLRGFLRNGIASEPYDDLRVQLFIGNFAARFEHAVVVFNQQLIGTAAQTRQRIGQHRHGERAREFHDGLRVLDGGARPFAGKQQSVVRLQRARHVGRRRT